MENSCNKIAHKVIANRSIELDGGICLENEISPVRNSRPAKVKRSRSGLLMFNVEPSDKSLGYYHPSLPGPEILLYLIFNSNGIIITASPRCMRSKIWA